MREDILNTDKDTLVRKKHLNHIRDINKEHNYYTLHQMIDGSLYLQGWTSEFYYLHHKKDDDCILHGIIYKP